MSKVVSIVLFLFLFGFTAAQHTDTYCQQSPEAEGCEHLRQLTSVLLQKKHASMQQSMIQDEEEGATEQSSTSPTLRQSEVSVAQVVALHNETVKASSTPGTMLEDATKADKKCDYGADRLFVWRGASATQEKCSESCLADGNCVAYSAIFDSWCVGCKRALNVVHIEAKAFKKVVDETMKVSCKRPSGWCTHTGAKHSEDYDCDGDCIKDPSCDDGKQFGFLSSADGCKDSWPNGVCQRVECSCTTPGDRAAGNKYTCSDGSFGYCGSNEICYSTAFPKGCWQHGCLAELYGGFCAHGTLIAHEFRTQDNHCGSCEDGYQLEDKHCQVKYAGTCANGELIAPALRTQANHCGQCDEGYQLRRKQCQPFRYDKLNGNCLEHPATKMCETLGFGDGCGRGIPSIQVTNFTDPAACKISCDEDAECIGYTVGKLSGELDKCSTLRGWCVDAPAQTGAKRNWWWAPRYLQQFQEPVFYKKQFEASCTLQSGDRVVRGPDWIWGDDDGGAGNLGNVMGVVNKKEFQYILFHAQGRFDQTLTQHVDVVVVNWAPYHLGKVSFYRCGVNGAQDLLKVVTLCSELEIEVNSTNRNLCVPDSGGKVEYTGKVCAGNIDRLRKAKGALGERIDWVSARAKDMRQGLTKNDCTWDWTRHGHGQFYAGRCGRWAREETARALPLVCYQSQRDAQKVVPFKAMSVSSLSSTSDFFVRYAAPFETRK